MNLQANQSKVATHRILRACLIITSVIASSNLASTLFTPPPPRTIEDTPTDLDDMIQRMEWASNAATSSTNEPNEDMTQTDKYHVLLTLLLATNPSSITAGTDRNTVAREGWLTNPAFLTHLEELVGTALKSKICSIEAMPMVFDAIRLLPDSDGTADLVIEALDHPGTSNHVWVDNLHARLSVDDIEKIRVDVLNNKVNEVKSWQLVILSTSTIPQSGTAIEDFIHRLRKVEAVSINQRPLGRRYSDRIQRLATLCSVRHNPEKLINWAIEQGVMGIPPSSIWALNEVLSLEGTDATLWDDAWDHIHTKSIVRAGEYYERSNIEPSKTLFDTYIANWLHPWIFWADEHGVAVPKATRDKAPPKLIFPSMTP